MKRNILRRAVGLPDGPRSSVWRLWGNKKGDLYVALRVLGGIIKASFHRDGKCQVGFTEEYAAKAAARFGTKTRHWETWKLPTEPVARVLQILVPTSELRSFQGGNTKEVVWLPAPDCNHLIATTTIMLAPLLVELEASPTLPGGSLVGTVRTNLRNAWVFYAHNPVDDALARIITDERAKLRHLPVPGDVPQGTRVALWDSRPDHDRHVLELAYEPIVAANVGSQPHS